MRQRQPHVLCVSPDLYLMPKRYDTEQFQNVSDKPKKLFRFDVSADLSVGYLFCNF